MQKTLIMSVYKLTECSNDYLKTFGSSWQYYEEDSENPITNFASCRYKKDF